MRLWEWLGRRDPDYAALRRAARAAIVMPATFAVGDKVIGNTDVATFAVFGSFAMLLLVDFGGPLVQRLQAQVALALVGALLISVGTAASVTPWIGALSMAVVGFGVLFAGVVSSTLAAASTALLLAFILPVSVPAPLSAVPERLEGWGLAGACGIIAIAVLWPAPPRDRLRPAAIAACEALAARIRAELTFVLSGGDKDLQADRDRAVDNASDAIDALHRKFLATPYRPGGLGTAGRTLTRLVAELDWLHLILKKSSQLAPSGKPGARSRPVGAVKVASAGVLERGAELLTLTGGKGDALQGAMSGLSEAVAQLEDHAAAELPGRAARGTREQEIRTAGDHVSMLVTALDPAFRAQEVGYAVTMIGRTIALTAAADRRSWLQRMLGRRPQGLPRSLAAAEERAAAHVQPHSVWLRNSIRGAAGLGLAVLVARLTGVQHSFWVVLGTLSVLRSNALSTGQDALRALAGTVVGLLVGVAILEGLGTNEMALWILLPIAILLAGVAPAAISFAAGQAAFTLTLVILFNLIKPSGWQVGLLRLEDIALGCGVSIVVGLLFWPRGASAVLRQALADAYAGSAAYLAGAVEFGIVRCTSKGPAPAAPTEQASRAAAADRRLDDAFRAYLAEHGPKPMPLADVTRLLTGASGVRLAAGAVVDLWRNDPGHGADRSAARGEILQSLSKVRNWYDDLAAGLTDGQRPDDPLGYDQAADDRLIEAVRTDLDSGDSETAATAVRIVWTGDHLDATRRLQEAIAPAAQQASRLQGASMLAAARTLWSSHGRPIS